MMISKHQLIRVIGEDERSHKENRQIWDSVPKVRGSTPVSNSDDDGWMIVDGNDGGDGAYDDHAIDDGGDGDDGDDDANEGEISCWSLPSALLTSSLN